MLQQRLLLVDVGAKEQCEENMKIIRAQYKLMILSVRVLIVDWDVHHGQGIQYLFQEDHR